MDNQAAMFTAQQMQYNKMYGMDPGRRMDELAAAQSQLNLDTPRTCELFSKQLFSFQYFFLQIFFQIRLWLN